MTRSPLGLLGESPIDVSLASRKVGEGTSGALVVTLRRLVNAQLVRLPRLSLLSPLCRKRAVVSELDDNRKRLA
jgi:hypothetical protein